MYLKKVKFELKKLKPFEITQVKVNDILKQLNINLKKITLLIKKHEISHRKFAMHEAFNI